MTSVTREQSATGERGAVEEFERFVMQISWLAQRQLMQLLDEDRFRLTPPQFYTLLSLEQVDEMKMSALAEATQQSAASLTGVVDRLADKQLVERTRPPKDRRQVVVLLTQRGRELLCEIRQDRRDRMQAALTQLSEAEIELLLHLLDRALTGMVRVLEHGEGGQVA